MSSTMTDGFHLVIDALKLNDIDTIYGVAGIPITDLLRLAQAQGVQYIGFRHESSAAHAAGIAGFITQKPGVCFTVSGPGFLNGMVAMANATTNGFPMILISGSSDRAITDLQKGDYEELDQMNAAKPYAKAAFRVNKPEDIGIGIARAIRTALSGRPGGVYLDLPADVLAAAIDAEVGQKSLIKVVDCAPAHIPSPESITRAADLIASAKNPLILLGKGAAYAQADEDIRALVETTGIPFLPMSMAKGLLPDNHPLSAAAARSLAIGKADVVILIGARMNWLLSHGQGPLWSENTKVVQIDISATEFDSNRAITAPIAGDIKSSVRALLTAVNTRNVKSSNEWLQEINEKKQQNVEKMAKRLAVDPSPMNFSSALRAVRDALVGRPDVYIVNEGANTLDFGRNIIEMYEPRKRLDSGTWGIMGIGMGYSIAAAVVSGKPVVAIEGDSAFGFSGMEIETICRYKLPIVTLVFNNGGIYRGDASDRTVPSPTGLDVASRYDRMMEAFGGVGYNVEDTVTLTSVVREALEARKPALVNIIIDPTAGTESGHIQNLNPKSQLQK